MTVEGADGVGQAGERQAIHVFAQHLRTHGVHVALEEGVDARGEDRVLVVTGRRLVVQVTVVPQAADFWRQAAVSSASTVLQTGRATDWIREAIHRKAARLPLAQRAGTVLLIDARHAGVLATGQLVSAYLERHGDPASAHAFASVWIIGPIGGYCTRVGSGHP